MCSNKVLTLVVALLGAAIAHESCDKKSPADSLNLLQVHLGETTDAKMQDEHQSENTHPKAQAGERLIETTASEANEAGVNPGRVNLIETTESKSTDASSPADSLQITQPAGCNCVWTLHNGKYSKTFVNGVSTAFNKWEAMGRCQDLGANVCGAVTCSGEKCTLRVNGADALKPSSSEKTWTPSDACFDDLSFLQITQPASGCNCRWTEHTGKYSKTYVNGDSTIFNKWEAMARCQNLGSQICRAVTCSGEKCTLRENGADALKPSSSEKTWTPSEECFSS